MLGFGVLFGIFVFGLFAFHVYYFGGITGFVVDSEGQIQLTEDSNMDSLQDSPGEIIVFVEIHEPSSGEVYEEGEEFLLNYSYEIVYGVYDSDVASSFGLCKYSLDNGKINHSLEDCMPKKISISEKGVYKIYVFVTETVSEIEGSSFVDIEVAEKTNGQSINSTGQGSPGAGQKSVESQIDSRKFYEINFSEIPEIELRRGENLSVELEARNTGKLAVANCAVEIENSFRDVVKAEDKIYNFQPGVKTSLVFEVHVPENFSPGNYEVGFFVKCPAESFESLIKIKVPESELELDIFDIRISGDVLEADYTARDLSGTERVVELNYFLINGQEKNAEGSEQFNLPADSSVQRKLEISLPGNINGEYDLVVEAVSGFDRVERREEVVLGSSGFTGLAVFTQGNLSGIGLIVLVVLSGALFLAVRFFRKRSSLEKPAAFEKTGRQFIKLHVQE